MILDFSWLSRPHELWIAAIAVVCSVACALPGAFLVLRRMSLLGDAISHSVLPGLAMAFILTFSRAPIPMLIGALIAGVIAAVASAALHRWGKVPEDAALGVVFSTMFAIGVILITAVASSVDLDANCVLYGLIELAPFDTTTIAGVSMPADFLWLSIIAAINAALIALFYKELQVVCFDPALATSMGIPAGAIHYALIGAVAATTVASFEAVGSILVITMLIAPAATAHLLTERLPRFLTLSAILAATAALLGTHVAIVLDTSVSGMISVAAGAQFALAFLFAPHHGIIARTARRLALSIRITREDILGALYRAEESQQADLSPSHRLTVSDFTPAESLNPSPAPRERTDRAPARSGEGKSLMTKLAQISLARHNLITPDHQLTDTGREAARQLIRSHRLWEAWLADNTTLPPDHLHAPAERLEHFITPALKRDLAQAVDKPTDPHGKAIP